MQNAENACECVREKMIRIPGKNDTRPESSCPAPPPDAVHSRATLASIADVGSCTPRGGPPTRERGPFD